MEKIIPVKILLYFTILVLSQLSSVKSVNANECIALNPSEGIEITTFSASVCINIRSLSTDNIYIFPDISQGISAEYLTTVKNTSGQTLFYNHISNNVVHSQLSTGSSNDVTVTLYPRTDGRKYIFTVNHQDIPEENQTLIYVGLTAWEFASNDNCGPTGCNGGGMHCLHKDLIKIS